MSNRRSHFLMAAAGMALAGMAGCMVGPPYQPPKPLPQSPGDSYKESPAQYQGEAAGRWKIAEPKDAMLRGKWWEIFHDEELNALEDQLNINNQNIKQYFEQFMAARAVIGQARAQLFPTVTIGGSYTRSRSSTGFVGSSNTVTGTNTGAGTTTGTGTSTGTTTGAGTTGTGTNTGTITSTSGTVGRAGGVTDFWSVPLEVSWEPDLWGKVRSAINQAVYSTQVSAADLESERLTEQASLAQYFYELRGQDALQKLYNDTVEQYKKALDLTQAQYQTGLTDQITVVEAENSLQSAEATAASIGIARAQYEHAIAMLIGKNPSQFSIQVKPFVTDAPSIPIGVPSQLLERRPDVAAAERTMAAANAQIGIEAAAYYPNLTLTAGAGFESDTLHTLFDWSNRFWSVGPSLSYTIFDAGLRRATLDQYIATYNADVAAYRQTVLTAFQQVEDNLVSLRLLSLQVEKEEQAVKSAQSFVDLETGRWQTGLDPYIDVVTAQTTLLGNQTTALNIHIQEMTSAVLLIEALGGGWDRSQLPTTRAVSSWPDKQDETIHH